MLGPFSEKVRPFPFIFFTFSHADVPRAHKKTITPLKKTPPFPPSLSKGHPTATKQRPFFSHKPGTRQVAPPPFPYFCPIYYDQTPLSPFT